jgi:hypothetical protein
LPSRLSISWYEGLCQSGRCRQRTQHFCSPAGGSRLCARICA